MQSLLISATFSMHFLELTMRSVSVWEFLNKRPITDIISFSGRGDDTCCWPEYFQCALQTELYFTVAVCGLLGTGPYHCSPSVLHGTGE